MVTEAIRRKQVDPSRGPSSQRVSPRRLGIPHLESISWVSFSGKRNPDLSEPRGANLGGPRVLPEAALQVPSQVDLNMPHVFDVLS